MADKVSIAFAADNNYAPYLGALIVSILKNAPSDTPFEFIVLDGGIGDRNKTLLKDLLQRFNKEAVFLFLPMDGQFKDCYVHLHFTPSIYYRLALPNLLNKHKKVLYLDVDTIVLEDITKLYNLDLQGKPIAACSSLMNVEDRVLLPDSRKLVSLERYFSDYLSLSGDLSYYFNSGVLLLDLEAMRKLNAVEKMLQEASKKKYRYPDQDILNKIFMNNYLRLDQGWNLFPHLLDNHQPAIIHFVGPTKPWQNLNVPGADFFFGYLRETFWYEKALYNCFLAQHPQPIKLKAQISKLVFQVWGVLPHSIRKHIKPIAHRVGGFFTYD